MALRPVPLDVAGRLEQQRRRARPHKALPEQRRLSRYVAAAGLARVPPVVVVDELRGKGAKAAGREGAVSSGRSLAPYVVQPCIPVCTHLQEQAPHYERARAEPSEGFLQAAAAAATAPAREGMPGSAPGHNAAQLPNASSGVQGALASALQGSAVTDLWRQSAEGCRAACS